MQEALTNVRRHAGPGATARIAINYLPTALHFSVRNETVRAPVGAGETVDGETSGTGVSGRGSGVAGMRARAEALGGRLEAGPLPDGGFLVSVLLPAGRSAAQPVVEQAR